MTECVLPQRVLNGLAHLDTLSREEAEAVLMLYDNHAQLHDECLDPRDYTDMAETLKRTGSNGLAEYALRRAWISGLKLWVPLSQMADIYGSLGQSDEAELLRGVEATLRGTPPLTPNGGEPWKNVECDADLSRCGDELHRIADQTNQHLRRFLLQSLYAGFYDPRSGLVQSRRGSQYLNNWLAMPHMHVVWTQNPRSVVEVVDYFIAKRKLEADYSDFGELTNTVLVVRELLDLTVVAIVRGEDFVHHENPDQIFFRFLREDGRTPFYGVGEGVAIYFNFLLKLPQTPYPDEALQKVLHKWSDSKELADRVAQRAKEYVKNKEKDR